MSNLRHSAAAARVGSLMMMLMLLSVSAARAQEPVILASAQLPVQQPPLVIAPPAATGPAFWELISGFEGDTEGSAYGFFGPSYVRPIRPGLSWTARAFGNYLAYEFSGADGDTRVRSPGVNAAVGLQFGDTSFFRVLAGPELKWRRTAITNDAVAIASDTDTRIGANFGGEMYLNPSSHNNIQGLINYNTSDRYSWGRIGFKEQVTNRRWAGPTAAFVGIEAIGQGNADIRSKQVGGFVELAIVPARVSLVVKGGFKQSTFDVGPNKSGPYFSAGFYRRMN